VQSLVRDGLAGERRDPASAPTEYASSEESTEKSGDSVLESPGHHSNARKYEAAETYHSSGVKSEGFEAVHDVRGSAHIDTSALGVSHAGHSKGESERSGGAGGEYSLILDLLTGNGEIAEASKTRLK
jgi:hypothetical protein